ncbi:MAG: hypothetical protein P8Y02_00870 [Deinococcales bacterium]
MLQALFPYTRRIGRGEYALRLLACLVVSIPVLLWRWEVVRTRQPGEGLLFLAVLVLVLALIQAQVIGRLRDVDASILLSGLVFIPYVNAAFALALLLFPGRTLVTAKPPSGG